MYMYVQMTFIAYNLPCRYLLAGHIHGKRYGQTRQDKNAMLIFDYCLHIEYFDSALGPQKIVVGTRCGRGSPPHVLLGFITKN